MNYTDQEQRNLDVATGVTLDRQAAKRAANADLAQLPPAQRLAKAVLLFLRGGPWLPEDMETWQALTGTKLATTRTLGDLARKVLDLAS